MRASAKPEPDASKNNQRNQYIPTFIAKKPFYIDDATQSQDDYLEHQRLQSEKNQDSIATARWYERGKTSGQRATKYRKGACENCGSMSHAERDCLQRKRKHGAKWTGRDIAADETVQDVHLGWDAKRDRWNGFAPTDYRDVVEEYTALEEMKRDVAGTGNDADAGDKYEAEADMGRQQSSSTRTLRLREDTAKYLRTLDVNGGPRYDPKTRTMFDADTDQRIVDDEFQPAAGDAAEFERATRYAWEPQGKGDEGGVHLQANPTAALLNRKRQAEEDVERQAAKKKALLDKYGSQEKVQQKAVLGAAATNETYVEYDERGRIKGQPEIITKSIYPEDVLANNHTAVWGSWWRDFQWGYACCNSTVKNSFCTGEEGKLAALDAENFSRGLTLPSAEDSDSAQELSKPLAQAEELADSKHVPNASDRPEKQHTDESRRSRLEEMKAGVTEADMEKYLREKTNKNDPMAGLIGKDSLLET